MKIFHLIHKAHKLEALLVTLATAGAVSGLQGWEWGLDRVGMYADVGAGVLFVLALIERRVRGHKEQKRS